MKMYPLKDNEVKCRISEGCFFAIGSYAKFKLEKVPLENDAGTDFRLIKQIERNYKTRDMGPVLEFQLKATTKWKIEKDVIKYSLETKNYNDIVSRNQSGTIPIILVLMCLPGKNTKEWITFHDDCISFKENIYWYHTDSDVLIDNENSTINIEVSRENQLTVDSFFKIVELYSVAREKNEVII